MVQNAGVSVLLELRVWWAEGGVERGAGKQTNVRCNRHQGLWRQTLKPSGKASRRVLLYVTWGGEGGFHLVQDLKDLEVV